MDFNIIIGNHIDLPVTIKNEDGTALNLTGLTVMFTMRASMPGYDQDLLDTEATIKKDNTVHTNAAGGITTFTLTKTETRIPPKVYLYDITVILAGGKPKTVLSGKMTFTLTSTRRSG